MDLVRTPMVANLHEASKFSGSSWLSGQSRQHGSSRIVSVTLASKGLAEGRQLWRKHLPAIGLRIGCNGVDHKVANRAHRSCLKSVT